MANYKEEDAEIAQQCQNWLGNIKDTINYLEQKESLANATKACHKKFKKEVYRLDRRCQRLKKIWQQKNPSKLTDVLSN